MRKIQRYGWKPDLPGKDPLFLRGAAPVIRSIDWWQKLRIVPKCYDQGQLGSCVGNGSARAIHFLQIEQGRQPVMPSRLQIYYDARAIEGTTQEDSGCQIRDAVLSLVTQGVCAEADWPYDIAKFDVRPPAGAYKAAAGQEVLEYRRVNNADVNDLMAALAIGRIIFGMTVYRSFESSQVARTGVVPMPSRNDPIVSGHCMLMTGADLDKGFAKADNSWSPDWGQDGRCEIPLEMITDPDIVTDCWLLSRIE